MQQRKLQYKIDDTYRFACEAFLHYDLENNEKIRVREFAIPYMAKMYCIYKRHADNGLSESSFKFKFADTFDIAVINNEVAFSDDYEIFLILKYYFEKFESMKNLERELTKLNGNETKENKSKI